MITFILLWVSTWNMSNSSKRHTLSKWHILILLKHRKIELIFSLPVKSYNQIDIVPWNILISTKLHFLTEYRSIKRKKPALMCLKSMQLKKFLNIALIMADPNLLRSPCPLGHPKGMGTSSNKPKVSWQCIDPIWYLSLAICKSFPWA